MGCELRKLSPLDVFLGNGPILSNCKSSREDERQSRSSPKPPILSKGIHRHRFSCVKNCHWSNKSSNVGAERNSSLKKCHPDRYIRSVHVFATTFLPIPEGDRASGFKPTSTFANQILSGDSNTSISWSFEGLGRYSCRFNLFAIHSLAT